LADCLREIHKLELVKPITTGEWRNLWLTHEIC
jgi:hypothetical protein